MCEANAYLLKEGREELIMESVDIVAPEADDTWRLVGIFGDQRIVKGRIRGMNLVNHRILFEAITPAAVERPGPASPALQSPCGG